MLHSSILIRTILFVLKGLEKLYDESMIHRALCFLGGGIKNLFSHSGLFGFFYSYDPIIQESFTFKCLRFIYRLVNTLVTWICIRIGNLLKGSKTFEFVLSFGKLDFFLSILGLMFFGFGLSLMIIFVLSKRVQALIGLVFILVAIFFLLLSKGPQEKIRHSRLVNLLAPFYRLFITDEEVDQWKF